MEGDRTRLHAPLKVFEQQPMRPTRHCTSGLYIHVLPRAASLDHAPLHALHTPVDVVLPR